MPYRDDFINMKKITRNQLRILTGIEMFYGNFEEMKYIYASREIPELADYMRKIQELNKMKSSMTSVVAAKGLSSLNEMLKKTKRLDSEITKLKNKLIEKMPKLGEYKITEEDIETMYTQA